MSSIDLKKAYPEYRATRSVASVDVPERQFLMVDGSGDPNTAQEYADAVQTLYPLAYALRAAVKDATGDAYTVMPLEGLWWVPDMANFDVSDKSGWSWTVMICVPDAVSQGMAADVIGAVSAAKQLASGHLARLETFTEGPAAQVLYTGPYADEGPTIAELHRYIAAAGHTLAGKHHEIYLSDPRTADPSKLRTILRQPFAVA